MRAEIFKTIIPQYNDDFDYDDSDTVLLHFESFLTYYEVCPASTQLDYVSKLQEISFVAARNPSKPETRYFCNPEQVYFSNEKLTAYFANASEVFILDQDFYIDFINGNKKEKFHNFLAHLGVSSIPKVKEVQLEVTTESKEQFALEGYEVAQTYIRNQSITDKILEGLEDATKAITPELSVIIWDYLLHHVQGRTISNANTFFSGTFRFVPKWNQYSKSEKFDSTLASILKNDKWLFDKEGNSEVAAQ